MLQVMVGISCTPVPAQPLLAVVTVVLSMVVGNMMGAMARAAVGHMSQ